MSAAKTIRDYWIDEIQTVTLNGRECRAFKASEFILDEFGQRQLVFRGAFTAPIDTPTLELWRIADEAE